MKLLRLRPGLFRASRRPTGSDFGFSIFFRISDFGLRISLTPHPTRNSEEPFNAGIERRVEVIMRINITCTVFASRRFIRVAHPQWSLFLTFGQSSSSVSARMNVIRYSDNDYQRQLRKLTSLSSLFDPTIEERTRAIVEAVYLRGDAALLEFTERFDGAKLTAQQLAVTRAEQLNASLKADDEFRATVALTSRNVEMFSRKSIRKNWSARNCQGARVGEKYDPFQRVGIYIPGGTAPLVSTALMTVTLARVAGCPEIVVCTPCGKKGEINPALLFSARAAGATEIYRLGGAQAIAAMAYGTPTIRSVQKIFGPGNAYVVAAKRLLFGYVAIDLLPGPSEVLVLADDAANPRFIAADLLAQAEHGSGHERVWLVTPSGKLLRAVDREIARQLPKLTRREFIRRALNNNGWLIEMKTLEEGIAFVNELAFEHCEVMTETPLRSRTES